MGFRSDAITIIQRFGDQALDAAQDHIKNSIKDNRPVAALHWKRVYQEIIRKTKKKKK